jgi:phosphate transport system substrate-binding protein
MTVATFILMPIEAEDTEASAAALKFFDWAYANGDGMAKELDYIPMPDSVVSKVKSSVWSQIKK